MNDLARIALAGTTKAAGDPPPGGTPLDELFGGQTGLERERALLLRAAAEATYQLAGHVPVPGVPLPESAPSENLKPCSPEIARLIGDMLAGRNAELLPEAFRLLAEARLRLPPTLLPLALRLGARDTRAALRPVLGERGRWLSRSNPEWSWATDEDVMIGGEVPPDAESIWQEGTHSQRLAILRRVRAEDPAMARAWITGAWREEKADFRNDMLEVLEQDFSRDDEPLVERALDDRAPTVRARAAALLARVPGTALTTRVRQRAEQLLRYTPPAPTGRFQGLVRSVLSGSKPQGTLAAVLPEGLDKDTIRDGIVAKPPQGLGERSWWLTQMLALVPPTHWSERWGASPSELIAAALTEDAGLTMIEGWSRAAVLHRSADWASALWQAWNKAKPDDRYYPAVRTEMLGALVAVLPPHEARDLALEMLRHTSVVAHDWIGVLRALPTPWDITFANAYLDAAHKRQHEYAFQATLDMAARALPTACFEHAFRLFSPAGDHEPLWYIREFLQTLEIRRHLHQEIRP